MFFFQIKVSLSAGTSLNVFFEVGAGINSAALYLAVIIFDE